VGGAVGAVVGGLAGSAVGEAIDPTVEDAYWRENYLQQPYYNEAKAKYPDLNFDRDYQGAYRLGYEKQYGYDPDVAFDEVEPELRLYWDQEVKLTLVYLGMKQKRLRVMRGIIKKSEQIVIFNLTLCPCSTRTGLFYVNLNLRI
jgi:hypothetical protein